MIQICTIKKTGKCIVNFFTDQEIKTNIIKQLSINRLRPKYNILKDGLSIIETNLPKDVSVQADFKSSVTLDLIIELCELIGQQLNLDLDLIEE